MSLSTLRTITDPSTRLNKSELYVIRSSIENAGKRLFTFKAIKKGKIICEYFGDVVLPEYLDNIANKYYLVTDDNETTFINALNA
jgi:hypothetical protein